MSSQADRIKALLGHGLSNQIVANTVGVEPSYVSQLMADEQFAEEVMMLRIQSLANATERDKSWDSLEQKLLGTLHEHVDNKMFYKPMDVLRALAVTNAAKRRGVASPEALTTHKPVVTLTIPATVIRQYKKTVEGEVVEIETADGEKKSLITMQSATLMKNLADQKSGRSGIDYEKIRRYLPGGSEREEATE